MKSYHTIIVAGIMAVCILGIVVVGFFAEAYESHTFPTYLFIASYDWLHNFYDHNIQGTGGGQQRDPDTDNFNKVIVVDSNLFPIMSSVVGDHEFPNITSRNTTTWDDASRSLYSPSVNDYFNRSVAAAPNFIPTRNFTYQINTTQNSAHLDQTGVTMRGGRSFMQWAFITDPGNHNIRRYEFRKVADYWVSLDPGDEEVGDFGGTIPDGDLSGSGIGQGDCQNDACDDGHWYYVKLEDAFSKKQNVLTGLLESYDNNPVYYFQRDAATAHPDTPDGWRNATTQAEHGVLEFMITLPEESLPIPAFLLTIGGNSPDQSANTLFVGLNAGFSGSGTPDPGVSPSQIRYCDANYEPGGSANDCAYRNADTEKKKSTRDFTFSNIDGSYDLDPAEDGVQLRVSIFPSGNGGFIIDGLTTTDRDSAFAVKRDEAVSEEGRWNDIASYLETLPPESYPGYRSYTSSTGRKLGYGVTTNTEFSHASDIRFKNPRDIDVYRDHFDPDNGGPLYMFVADTMNSRIQVFMNATGVAGRTGAEFPIRPVRVKGPNDTDGGSTAYASNELAVRLYSNGESVGFGDGRKADWRHYTSVTGSAFVNIEAGKGEFFYPHGIAVDQDPDTKDLYLFVADTFNHRIQVFRDAGGVSDLDITAKQFDFAFEKGWGTYPLQTSQTATPPGAYNFRYPKGLDVARFANNSSYLYVVDSKNYRLLKYLISEKPEGGIESITIDAGYGFDGINFVNTLTTNQGTPLTADSAKPGFLDPQDVATGYNGFYTYSGPDFNGSAAGHYPHERISDDDSTLKEGIKFLDNRMIYVTDYARNDASISADGVNMRVMQFLDNLSGANGVYLPWQTEPVPFDKGELGQSVFGVNGGVHQSEGLESDIPYTGTERDKHTTGSTENVPGVDGYFTDRPFGIDALTWDTVTPIDMRVINTVTGALYRNGATIPNNQLLRVGVRTRGFFGFPETDPATYTNYTAEHLNLEGKGIKRAHVFCYDATGQYVGHKPLETVPYTFSANQISGCSGGYVKIVAEEQHFDYSGKTGTLILQVQ